MPDVIPFRPTRSGHPSAPTSSISTIRRNSATYSGGGLYSTYGSSEIRSCLLEDNAAGLSAGGGVMLTYGALVLDGCTVVNNRSPSGGAGLNHRFGGSSLRVFNSIVYDNQAGRNLSYSTEQTGLTHELHYSCASPLDANLTLAVYVEHLTASPRFVDSANGNYRLLFSSPCVDSGTNSTWMTGAFDLDDRTRLVNGTVDRGCYEYHPIGTAMLFR